MLCVLPHEVGTCLPQNPEKKRRKGDGQAPLFAAVEHISLMDARKILKAALFRRYNQMAEANNTAPVEEADLAFLLRKRTADFLPEDFKELCEALSLEPIFYENNDNGEPDAPQSSSDEDEDSTTDVRGQLPAYRVSINRSVQIIDGEYGRVIFSDVASIRQPQLPTGSGLERRTFTCKILDLRMTADPGNGAADETDPNFHVYHVSLTDVRHCFKSCVSSRVLERPTHYSADFVFMSCR